MGPFRKPRRPVLRRRARLAVAAGIIAFLASQFVLNFFIEVWEPCVRYPEFGYRLAGLRRLLAAEPGRPLFLALGSSRTEMGFRPEVLPSYRTVGGVEPLVFNFGISGSGPLRQLLHLRRLLASGIRPDWIVLEISPFMLAAPDGGLGRLPNEAVSCLDLGILTELSPVTWTFFQTWLAHRLTPVHSDRKGLLCRYGPHFCLMEAFSTHGIFCVCPDCFGWLAWADADPTPERRRPWLARISQTYSGEVSDACDRILHRLLALCREQGISVALCLMPEGKDFRRRYVPSTLAALDAYLACLAREWRVPLIDARSWVADADFIDGHHLLQRGARGFTERLGRELIGPLVAGKLR